MSAQKLGNGTDGLPLPDARTGVDGDDNDAGETDAWEDPDYGADNSCKYRNARSDKSVDDVEAWSDDSNNRSNNIGPTYNNEADVLDKIVTNI